MPGAQNFGFTTQAGCLLTCSSRQQVLDQRRKPLISSAMFPNSKKLLLMTTTTTTPTSAMPTKQQTPKFVLKNYKSEIESGEYILKDIDTSYEYYDDDYVGYDDDDDDAYDIIDGDDDDDDDYDLDIVDVPGGSFVQPILPFIKRTNKKRRIV